MKELIEQLNAIVWHTNEGQLRIKAMQESRKLLDAINNQWHQIARMEGFEYEQETTPINTQQLIDIVADVYGVTSKELVSKNRRRDLVDARVSVIAYLRTSGFTWKKIATIMGRDHTTAIHSVRTHNNLMMTDDSYRDKYTTILTKLEQC